MRRLGILISGRGSNLQAIVDAVRERRLDAAIAVVISNRAEATGLQRARAAGIETVVLRARDHPDRDGFDRALAGALQNHQVDLVCLAGFMRIVGTPLLDAFPQRILNIHPSLLPAFPGVDAQAQAIEYGVKVSGCTVHFVDENLDAGPIIVQRTVPVRDDDDADTLAARILEQEHIAYVEALEKLRTRKWRIEGRRVIFS